MTSRSPNELLIEALAAPLLEPELSGEQIGRNRMAVIERLSNFLGNAQLQVWLVEQHADRIETRLGYWYPLDATASDLSGNIVVDQGHVGDILPTDIKPSSELWERVRGLFEKHGHLGTAYCFPIHSPIPVDFAVGKRADQRHPIAWVFASISDQPVPEQLAAAKALSFHLAILLQYGRTHRLVEATEKCASLLYETRTLEETLAKCADVLVESCAAQGGGYLEFTDGNVHSLAFANGDSIPDARRATVERFVRTSVQATPILNDLAISVADGLEIQVDPEFGNFLYIPIMGPSLNLESSTFIAITEADDLHTPELATIGAECEKPSHALFLFGKKSPAYLGVNFSETDRTLCRTIARGLSSAVYSRFFEELFLSQARYFSSLPSDNVTNAALTFRSLKSILPGARSLQLVTVTRDRSGVHQIAAGGDGEHTLPSAILDLILDQSRKIHTDLSADSKPKERGDIQDTNGSSSEHLKNIQCACHTSAAQGTWLIFQMSTRYEPLRFYALQLGSNYIERFRFHLLKHFMRELYHLHRTKDSAVERSSLLAQIRHAVVNPIAASTNSIDTFQRYLQLYGRTDEGWLKIKNEKEIRDLIPHAIYLNHQALLFINSGRFLFSSIGYGEIKFDQYRPLELFNEVRLAFNYGAQERGQSFNLKIVGDANLTAVGDRLLLWIVIANLVDNAIKYGHRDTEIVVTLDFRTDRWIFSVENTGDYLSPSVASRIFKPFERGDSSAPNINRRHGTGLGVTVSEMILRAHSDIAGLKYTSAFKSGEQKRAQTRFSFEMPYKLSKQGTERRG